MMKDITFIVAGHSESRLVFSPGPNACGCITDGISLKHGDRGGWVVDYKDLKTMYEMATSVRVKKTKKGK